MHQNTSHLCVALYFSKHVYIHIHDCIWCHKVRTVCLTLSTSDSTFNEGPKLVTHTIPLDTASLSEDAWQVLAFYFVKCFAIFQPSDNVYGECVIYFTELFWDLKKAPMGMPIMGRRFHVLCPRLTELVNHDRLSLENWTSSQRSHLNTMLMVVSAKWQESACSENCSFFYISLNICFCHTAWLQW